MPDGMKLKTKKYQISMQNITYGLCKDENEKYKNFVIP